MFIEYETKHQNWKKMFTYFVSIPYIMVYSQRWIHFYFLLAATWSDRERSVCRFLPKGCECLDWSGIQFSTRSPSSRTASSQIPGSFARNTAELSVPLWQGDTCTQVPSEDNSFLWKSFLALRIYSVCFQCQGCFLPESHCFPKCFLSQKTVYWGNHFLYREGTFQHGSSCLVGHSFQGRGGNSSQEQNIHQILSLDYENTCTGSHCLLVCLCVHFETNAHPLMATAAFKIMLCQFLSQWLLKGCLAQAI